VALFGSQKYEVSHTPGNNNKQSSCFAFWYWSRILHFSTSSRMYLIW